MKRVLRFFLCPAAVLLVIAANHGNFESLSDTAPEKYPLRKHLGSNYATKISDSSTEPMLHAMDVCGSVPSSTKSCDIIIIVVATDGHFRLLFSPYNQYVDCVRKTFASLRWHRSRRAIHGQSKSASLMACDQNRSQATIHLSSSHMAMSNKPNQDSGVAATCHTFQLSTNSSTG